MLPSFLLPFILFTPNPLLPSFLCRFLSENYISYYLFIILCVILCLTIIILTFLFLFLSGAYNSYFSPFIFLILFCILTLISWMSIYVYLFMHWSILNIKKVIITLIHPPGQFSYVPPPKSASYCFLKQSPCGKKSQVLLWYMSHTSVSCPV